MAKLAIGCGMATALPLESSQLACFPQYRKVFWMF